MLNPKTIEIYASAANPIPNIATNKAKNRNYTSTSKTLEAALIKPIPRFIRLNNLITYIK